MSPGSNNVTVTESLVQLSALEIIFHAGAALFVVHIGSISEMLKAAAMLEAPGPAISSADPNFTLRTRLRPSHPVKLCRGRFYPNLKRASFANNKLVIKTITGT